MSKTDQLQQRNSNMGNIAPLMLRHVLAKVWIADCFQTLFIKMQIVVMLT